MNSSFFGGVVRLAVTLITVAGLGGCAGGFAATAVKAAGGTDRQAVAAFLGAEVGSSIAHANRQQAVGNVTRPTSVDRSECTTKLGGVLRTVGGREECYVGSARFGGTSARSAPPDRYCLYQTGWASQNFPGIPRNGALQSAGDTNLGRWMPGMAMPAGHALKPC